MTAELTGPDGQPVVIRATVELNTQTNQVTYNGPPGLMGFGLLMQGLFIVQELGRAPAGPSRIHRV